MTNRYVDRREKISSRSMLLSMAIVASSIVAFDAKAQATGGTYSAHALVRRLDGSILEDGDYGYFSTPQSTSLFSAGFSVGASANDNDGGTAYVGLSYTAQGLVPASEYIREMYANAGVEYQFMLSGAPSAAPISVSMLARGSASEGASARVSLSGIGANVTYNTAVGVASSFSELAYFDFVPNQIYRVSLYAQTSFYNFGYLPEGAQVTQSAFADPIFTILGDAADSYSFVGLPASAIGNALPPSGAVPEPATWAMMLAGFGVIGAQMRRRHTRVRLA
jgi:hypothetical protein